jgi:glycosyltransferase involved in cell wall biosynthesis
MTNPKLSIIIPVYNVEHFLPETIKSIQCQHYTDYEVILVDDGSKDNSLNVCRELASKDERINVYHKDNSGVSDTRNVGLGKAIGDYVYFMDSDDLLHPQFIEIMMNCAEKNDADLVCCEYTTFIKKPMFPKIKDICALDLRENNSDPFDVLTLAAHATSMCSKVLKRTLLHSYNIKFRSGMTFGEDMFVAWKCCLVSQKAYFVRQPLYYYRQTGNSAVSRYHANLYESYRSSFDEIKQFVADYNIQVNRFQENYARYFAQRLNSFVRMEVKAPYSIKYKVQRLSLILSDNDMQQGLNLSPGTNPLYEMARSKAIGRMLLYGYKNELIANIKNAIKKMIR